MTNFYRFLLLIISTITASCATSGKDGDTNNNIIQPTVIQPIAVNNDFSLKLKQVREADRYKAFLEEGNGNNNISNLQYHKGLDKLIAYGLLNPSKKGERRIAFIGHRVQHSTFMSQLPSQITTTHECLNLACKELDKNSNINNTYVGGNSNATLGFLLMNFDTENKGGNMWFGISSNKPSANIFIAESSSPNTSYETSNLIKAIQEAQKKGHYTLVYDFADGLRLNNSYKWVTLDNSSILQSGGSVAPLSKVKDLAYSMKEFLESGSKTVAVMPTGTLTKYGSNPTTSTNLFVTGYNPLSQYLSYGVFDLADNRNKDPVFTDGLLTGNLVQILQSSHGFTASQNNIALSVPVFSDGSKDSKGDFIYNPDKKAILPGTLRDYAFAIAIREGFATKPATATSGATMNGISTPSGTSTVYNVSEGRFANMMLAGAINVVAQHTGDERKAVSLLKTNYTIKQYASTSTSNLTSNIYETGKFYTLDKNNLLTLIDAGPNNLFTKKIIAYFDQYSSLNGGKVKDPSTGVSANWGSGATIQDKINSIKQIYGARPELLAQFITENDVIVCDGTCNPDNSNIVFMNGQAGKPEDFKVEKKPYTFVDKDGNLQVGESTIYKYKGQIISSNLFGNGIVSFDAIDKTTVKGTNHNIFATKASTSSLFGNAFANSGLGEVNVILGAVYEDAQTEDVMSVVLANDSNLIEAKRASAISNFGDRSLATENARFNFGKIKFGFMASQKQEKNEILKSMTDYKALFDGSEENLATTSDISFVIPFSSTMSIGVLSKGSNLDALRISSNSEGFSLITKNNGFRQTHSNFVSIFEAGKNLKATSFEINGANSNFNIITAFNEKENIYTGKNEAKYLGMVEGEVRKSGNTSKFSFGVRDEEASIYGSHFAGGVAIEGSTTAFLGFETKQKLSSGLFGLFGFNYGVSFVREAKDSLLANFSNIHSSNINAGVGYEGAFGVVAFNYSTGLASHYGNATAFNGKDYNKFSLKADAVEQNFELSFANKQTQYSNIKLALIHTENVANMQGERQNIIAVKASKKF